MRLKFILILAAAVVVMSLASTSFAALLNDTIGLPLIFSFSLDSNVTTYDGTDEMTITASPTAMFGVPGVVGRPRLLDPTSATPTSPAAANTEMLSISVKVDNTGALIGGVPGDDFKVVGKVDLTVGSDPPETTVFNGILLTGEVMAFGFHDSGGTTDLFDFQITLTGGLLAAYYGGIGQGIGVEVTSEGSNFTGDFTVSFAGKAKANIGSLPQCIKLEKQVSIDHGLTFFDADDPGDSDVPVATVGSYATYQLIVENCGGVALKNVRINDKTLGIVDFFLAADLAVGNSVTLTEEDIPELHVSKRCTNEGTFTNVATVTGESIDTGASITDSDAAVLICDGIPGKPAIQIRKQISVDGGTTFADADNPGDPDVPQVTAPSDALYQLVITNVGTVNLMNVIVNDATLDIVNFSVGHLYKDEEVILTKSDIPLLDVVDRCEHAGTFSNVAEATGEAVYTSEMVSDSDQAVLSCMVACAIEVEETCAVVKPSSSNPMLCQDKIKATTLRYIVLEWKIGTI